MTVTSEATLSSIPIMMKSSRGMLLVGCYTMVAAAILKGETASIRMVTIPAGEFQMGNEGEIDYRALPHDERHPSYMGKGSSNPYLKEVLLAENPLEWDEKPVHRVCISQPFEMSAMPVTNAQYEAFRPEHRQLRGKQGFSKNDDDAVVFVSWHDAVAYTGWLSKKKGQPYRLPTEAEWEYAVRAGTVTAYSTGDHLPESYGQHQVTNRYHSIDPTRVNLAVGRTPANPLGLHDMHGLVEEWCLDWYGPYSAESQTDPAGPATGDAKVTRGGSHSTGWSFLRSANRSAALPESRSFAIGFRVVKASAPPAQASAPAPERVWTKDVIQKDFDWNRTMVPNDRPVFATPKTYTRIEPEANGPLYSIHNHEPALTVLPNGDLLAIWFTTVSEFGREMVIAGSRLRNGATQWDKPDVFFHVADRNLTGQTLWWNGGKTVYHLSGVGSGDGWQSLSIAMRTSSDNGVNWSEPKIISSEFGLRNQPIDAMIQTQDGSLVFLADADWTANGGSAVYVSKNGGKIWNDPGRGKPKPDFKAGGSGGWIAGIHAGIVELTDGSWLALGRGDAIEGKMPMSRSHDQGITWIYEKTSLTSLESAQRLGLIRLKEGPLLLVSFEQQMADIISNGKPSKGVGIVASLSYDEGKTWPTRRLVTLGEGKRVLDAPCNLRWGAALSTLDKTHAEQRGYLTVTQAPDGMIHLLSSGTHYAFNLKWITE
jgi:sulfatase modifying factor 1